jgi:hypothetical protein
MNSEQYKRRYKHLLSGALPRKVFFRNGRDFERFFCPKRIRQRNRKKVAYLPFEEAFTDAVKHALTNHMFFSIRNYKKLQGKPLFLDTFFRTILAELEEKDKNKLIIFCTFGTSMDYYHSTDVVIMIGKKYRLIDLTLDPFKDQKHKKRAYCLSAYDIGRTFGSWVEELMATVKSAKEMSDIMYQEIITTIQTHPKGPLLYPT